MLQVHLGEFFVWGHILVSPGRGRGVRTATRVGDHGATQMSPYVSTANLQTSEGGDACECLQELTSPQVVCGPQGLVRNGCSWLLLAELCTSVTLSLEPQKR